MDPEHAKLLAQAFQRDARLSATLHAIAALDPSQAGQAASMAADALRHAPPVIALPQGVKPQGAEAPAHDPIERLLAAFTRLLVAAEAVTDRTKIPTELVKARHVLSLAVVVARAEARDLLPVEGMDAIALAIFLQRQNEAFRATLEAAREVVIGFSPGSSTQRTHKARLLQRIDHALSLKNPLAAPFHAWPTAEVVPFPKRTEEPREGQG